MSLRLKSGAFANGGSIPRRFTGGVSPPLAWEGEPAGTRSYALIVDDPDAPRGTWNHWLMWNRPAKTHALPVGYRAAPPARCGQNDFGEANYGGPSPPPGPPHRYFFRLFALDAPLDLEGRVKREALEQAMAGHVLAQATCMGRYQRPAAE